MQDRFFELMQEKQELCDQSRIMQAELYAANARIIENNRQRLYEIERELIKKDIR